MLHYLLHTPAQPAQLDRSSALGRCGQEEWDPISSAPKQGLPYLTKGLATIISHSLQFHIEKFNFLVSTADRLESPFLHPAATHRVEAPRIWGPNHPQPRSFAGQRFQARKGELRRSEDCTTPASRKVD